jgi:hypothetical protein
MLREGLQSRSQADSSSLVTRGVRFRDIDGQCPIGLYYFAEGNIPLTGRFSELTHEGDFRGVLRDLVC